MSGLFSLLKSKTVWGAILTFGPNLVQALFTKDPMQIAAAAGPIIGIAGGRHALDKVAETVAAAQGKK